MKLKRYFFIFSLLLPTYHLAVADGHYPDGAEGIKGATLPPPGVYTKWYNMYYTSDTVKDKNGDNSNVSQELDTFATVPRFIWISNQKILGGDYGINVAVPFVNVSLKTKNINQSKFNLGDILLEQVLGWHLDQWDFSAATGVWFPVGNFDATEAVNIGKGFWTGMFTAGATHYFDKEKTWHFSALSRYQTNSSKSGIDIRPGGDFLVEWGLGKTLAQNWNIGISSYTHWQVTSDTGSAVNYDAGAHARYYAIGPEISYFYEPAQTSFEFRYQKEFAVVNYTEGQKLTFSFVVIF